MSGLQGELGTEEPELNLGMTDNKMKIIQQNIDFVFKYINFMVVFYSSSVSRPTGSWTVDLFWLYCFIKLETEDDKTSTGSVTALMQTN